ncbi:hypothetical protein [Actinoplanes friuliensis]|nr:hypothetical protein [Actinoplanes friuliensis]
MSAGAAFVDDGAAGEGGALAARQVHTLLLPDFVTFGQSRDSGAGR